MNWKTPTSESMRKVERPHAEPEADQAGFEHLSIDGPCAGSCSAGAPDDPFQIRDADKPRQRRVTRAHAFVHAREAGPKLLGSWGTTSCARSPRTGWIVPPQIAGQLGKAFLRNPEMSVPRNDHSAARFGVPGVKRDLAKNLRIERGCADLRGGPEGAAADPGHGHDH